jgi:hypothetical protein
MDEPTPDSDLTVVFTTSEPGLLPLATLALEQQQIEFATRLEGSDALTAGGIAYRGHASEEPIEILVRQEDAARARDLLRDLESGVPSAAAPRQPASSDRPITSTTGRIALFDADTNQPLGHITDDDLQWLDSQLEKESVDDHDYYFDAPTLDMLESAGARAELMAVLRALLAGRESVDVRWSREE